MNSLIEFHKITLNNNKNIKNKQKQFKKQLKFFLLKLRAYIFMFYKCFEIFLIPNLESFFEKHVVPHLTKY